MVDQAEAVESEIRYDKGSNIMKDCNAYGGAYRHMDPFGELIPQTNAILNPFLSIFGNLPKYR